MDTGTLIRRIRRWMLRLYGLDEQRLVRETELRTSLLRNILHGTAVLLAVQAVVLTSGGAKPGELLWTTWEPGLLLVLAYGFNRSGQILSACTWLLVGLSHAAAFTHTHYGLEHLSGSLLALTIVVCGLLVGAYFIRTWTGICCLVVFWLAKNQSDAPWSVALGWCAVYIITGWLVILFSRHLERLVEFNRSAEERQRNAIVAERTRFAREIHDTLAQGFTGVIMQLNAAELRLAESSEVAKAHLEKARQLARESLEEARRSALALRPGPLANSGLLEAVERSARELLAGDSIELETLLEGQPYPLPEETETHLLRIGQEALTNALRHANPTRIAIRVRYDGSAVELEVRDNGVGMIDGSSTSGLGMTNMAERAEHVGGRLIVESTPGSGTTVLVRLRQR